MIQSVRYDLAREVLETNQTSKRWSFSKIFKGLKPLSIFTRASCQMFDQVLSTSIMLNADITWLLMVLPSGPVEVQWKSIERPYWTCGRPKGTFNGSLVDVPNETQLIRPNKTKMDVHFRPSRDAMHGTWTSSGPPPDVGQTSTGRPLDVIFDWYGAWTSFQTSI